MVLANNIDSVNPKEAAGKQPRWPGRDIHILTVIHAQLFISLLRLWLISKL